jgi:chorismate synthase
VPVAALLPQTNHAGGTLGGLSSGAPLVFRVAVKPVSTIRLPQATADWFGAPAVLEARGRHDACVLPRVPPIVEAMAALVLADLALAQRARLAHDPPVPPERHGNDVEDWKQ